MKKKVLSSLVLSGTVFVMAPQAWSQAGGASGSGSAGAGRSGSETQAQKPTAPPMGGQQRSTPGSSSELQSERSSGQGATQGQVQGQRTAGQQLSKEKVKQIQEALKEKGNDPGQADGIMGPKTQQALRAFQKSQNLEVTGRVDEKTASALGVEIEGSDTGASSPGKSSSSQGAGGRNQK